MLFWVDLTRRIFEQDFDLKRSPQTVVYIGLKTGSGVVSSFSDSPPSSVGGLEALADHCGEEL